MITLGLFLLLFYLLLFGDAVIMIFRGVDLLRCVVKLYGLGTLVAAGSGFLVFKWELCAVLFELVLK